MSGRLKGIRIVSSSSSSSDRVRKLLRAHPATIVTRGTDQLPTKRPTPSYFRLSHKGFSSRDLFQYECYSSSRPRMDEWKCKRWLSNVPINVVTDSPTRNDSSDPESAIQAAIDEMKTMMESKSSCHPQQVDSILERLENQRIVPTFECYYWAIECSCRTKRKGSEERLEGLIHKLRRAFNGKVLDMEQRQRLQTTMMHMLRAYHHVSNAHRAEEWLLQFIQDDDYQNPSLITMEMCKSVLSTWSRSDSSRRASRAESFMSIMRKEEALPDPDITCYTLVLNCWASSNKENAPRRAELLLRSMEVLHDENLQPNMLSYTCVLNAWSRSYHPDAPVHAERLFQEMTTVKGWIPDRVVYNAMITTWGRATKIPKSIVRAEEYFYQLQTRTAEEKKKKVEGIPLSQSDDEATVVEYSALIQAWANYVEQNVGESRKAVTRVEELVDELMGKYFATTSSQQQGQSDGTATTTTAAADRYRPNRMTFASVLRTINAARRIPDRGDRADAVVRKMQRLKLEANPYILGLVEKCSRSGPVSSTGQKSSGSSPPKSLSRRKGMAQGNK